MKKTDCREFIVYACPAGALAIELENYFNEARTRAGSNTAHEYMPHCTLTGFFHDDLHSIPSYISALEQALTWGNPKKTSSPIEILGLTLDTGFHFLTIRSAWLESITSKFSSLANSSSRLDNLRLKTNLHVSLAYGFAPEREETLREIAQTLNWQAPVMWNIRLYERHSSPSASSPPMASLSPQAEQQKHHQRWTCHKSWKV